MLIEKKNIDINTNKSLLVSKKKINIKKKTVVLYKLTILEG